MKFFLYLICLMVCIGSFSAFGQQKFTLSGYIREASSGELMPGAAVYIPALGKGTSANNYGFYSITLPADTINVVFSLVGYTKQARKIALFSNISLDIGLENFSQLSEVVVEGNMGSTEVQVSGRPSMSVINIPVENIKDIPALLGEKDVLKVIQLLPGVQKGSEGSSGLYVRGGGPDQNLIILDDAPLYNAFHLFGFFSLFNGDALKSIELTKGGFPARYGGRLSSVVEMNMKDGNRNKIKGEGGIGIIASRFMIEGPLKKNVSSFLISARRTYIDVLAAPLIAAAAGGGVRAGYFFYDLNAKVNYDISKKDKLYLSGYFGRDKFYFKEKISGTEAGGGLYWGNATGTLRWNRLINEKLFSNVSLIANQYRFTVFAEEKISPDQYSLRYFSGIRDYTLKADYDYLPNPDHKIRFGGQASFHTFTPGAVVIKGSFAEDNVNQVEQTDALETGLYLEDIWTINSRWTMNAGLRMSGYLVDKKQYVRPEPRLQLMHRLTEDFSIKGSYATMNQYMHLISNTGVGLPTDLWVPATRSAKPQTSQQVALGIAKDFTKQKINVQIEGYYKDMRNVVGYKPGASFLDIAGDVDQPNTTTRWEDNITQGKSWSYGMEFFVQKRVGKFTGWVGYTLSWTQLQFDSINFGRKFYARFDRRHDISAVAMFKMFKDISLAITWVYGTGNAITLPVSSFGARPHRPGQGQTGGQPGGFEYIQQVSSYSQKNDFRMAAYHRLDAAIQFRRASEHFESMFEFGVYNAYNRQNPFFYYADESNGRMGLKQVTLFPLLPSLSWNFKF